MRSAVDGLKALGFVGDRRSAFLDRDGGVFGDGSELTGSISRRDVTAGSAARITSLVGLLKCSVTVAFNGSRKPRSLSPIPEALANVGVRIRDSPDARWRPPRQDALYAADPGDCVTNHIARKAHQMRSWLESGLDELDIRLRGGPREHGQVFMLDAFRRHVREAAGEQPERHDRCRITESERLQIIEDHWG